MLMPMTIDGKEYLNTTEAQKFLGNVSTDTLRGMVQRGALHPKKRAFGKAIYYDKAELEDALKLRDVDFEEGE